MEPEKKPNGALVGLIVIVIILVVGGIYIWQSKTEKTKMEAGNLTNQDSTELDSLEAEIDTTEIDVGASAIESVE